MIEGWVLWLVLVVVAVGVVVVGVTLVRLPRDEDDISASERRMEAAWIASVIERHGGIAPRSLVEEVLDLHQAYLQAPRVPSGGPAPVTPAAAPPGRPSGQTPPAQQPPGRLPPPPPPGYGPPPAPPGGESRSS